MSNITNKLFHGDSRNCLRSMPDQCIDLVVTSPPYDNLRSYDNVDWNMDIFKDIASQLNRVLKKGGIIVWVVNDAVKSGSETGTSFRQALYFMDIGFNLHDTMIFEKNTSSFPANRKGNRYTQIFEYMFVFSKGKPKTANLICDKPNKWAGYTNFGKNTVRKANDALEIVSDIKPVPEFSPRNNVWKYQVNFGYSTKDKEAHEHPAIFPEKLVEDHILSWSNEGDIVLDPFCGSGTTLKVAALLKRSYVGIEINKKFCDITESRMKKVFADKCDLVIVDVAEESKEP